MAAVQEALQTLMALPVAILYLVLAAGAAIENIFPPIPADAFVVAAGMLATYGVANPWTVFAVTWTPNVATSLLLYYAARRYGGRFFKMPIARWLLREHQLEGLARFYGRWGVPAILVGRLLPGWRAMVPVFAGISHMRPRHVIPPLALASAFWYALLLQVGLLAGRNLEAILQVLAGFHRVLLGLGLAALVLAGAWWWRTRHPRSGP
jgi:membrane protein DedA with SNARE-associated domain